MAPKELSHFHCIVLYKVKVFIQKHNKYLLQVVNGGSVESSLVVCVCVPHIREGDSYQVHNGDICRAVADRRTASIYRCYSLSFKEIYSGTCLHVYSSQHNEVAVEAEVAINVTALNGHVPEKGVRTYSI